jgi:hypothetical protein
VPPLSPNAGHVEKIASMGFEINRSFAGFAASLGFGQFSAVGLWTGFVGLTDVRTRCGF